MSSSFLEGHGFRADSEDVTCDVCGYVWDGNAQCTMCDPEPASSDTGDDEPPLPVALKKRPPPRFYDALTGVLSAYRPTKENRYTAQLNLYAHILNKKYKLRVRDLMLVRLDPESDEHQVLHVPMMPAEAALLAGPLDALAAGAEARDPLITFDEASHTYAIAGVGPVSQSVTAVVGNCFPRFDPDSAIAAMRAGAKWGPVHRYWGQADDDIKRAWAKRGRDAAAAGTALHDRIDAYYKAQDLPPAKRRKTAAAEDSASIHPGFAAFDQDMQRRGWRILRTEWRVFSSQRLAGSIDAVYASVLHPAEIAVVDWKVTAKPFEPAHFGKL